MSGKLRLCGASLVIAAAAFMAAKKGKAEPPSPAIISAFNARCATRLSIAFTGKTATTEQLSSPDPKLFIDGYLASEDFRERFARFINTEFNSAPGATSLEDAPYHIAKQVLKDDRSWSDLFLGKFRLSPVASNVAVFEDESGLGYFRSEDWYRRYEGNEEQGIKLSTAYRIMNNVVGLKLTAVTASPNSDQTANGRQAAPCNGCHFDGWYALDKVAQVLPKRGQRFDSYTGGAREMLGGKQIANDKELVTALVESENFSVNACRLSFKFLYGREDNGCEAATFDRCVDTFKVEKKITSALGAIAREPGFCE